MAKKKSANPVNRASSNANSQQPAIAPPAAVPPSQVFDTIEARQIIVRDSTGAPRIVMGVAENDEKSETSIEIKTPSGDSRIKLRINDRQAACIWIENSQKEAIVLSADGDELQIELSGKRQFPRFAIGSNDDMGIITSFFPIAPKGATQHASKISVGLDTKDQVVVSVSSDSEVAEYRRRNS